MRVFIKLSLHLVWNGGISIGTCSYLMGFDRSRIRSLFRRISHMISRITGGFRLIREAKWRIAGRFSRIRPTNEPISPQFPYDSASPAPLIQSSAALFPIFTLQIEEWDSPNEGFHQIVSSPCLERGNFYWYLLYFHGIWASRA